MNGFIRGFLYAFALLIAVLALLFLWVPSANAQTTSNPPPSCWPKQVLGGGSLAHIHRTDVASVEDWSNAWPTTIWDTGALPDAVVLGDPWTDIPRDAAGAKAVMPRRLGGTLRGSTTTFSAARHGPYAGGADQWAMATVVQTHFALSLRTRSAMDSSYRLWVRSTAEGGMELVKRVAGVGTSMVVKSTIGAKPGDHVFFTVRGSALKGYLNGMEVIAATDTSLVDPGKPGIAFWGNTAALKLFEGGPFNAPVQISNGPTWFAWWWCERDFDQHLSLLACPEAKLTECASPDVRAVLAAPTGAALTTLWSTKVKMAVTDPSLVAAFDKAIPEIKKTQPAPPAYVVAKNGTLPTRPAYAYIPASGASAASRATISTTRATVGATCNCKINLIETTVTGRKTVFCNSNIAMTEVAVCVRP
jgi:hypothetical protein